MTIFLGSINSLNIVDQSNLPRILTRTSNQTVNLSETVILTCHISDLGNHHVTWLKFDRNTLSYLPLAVGEHVFVADSRYSVSSYAISSRISYWNLEIYRVQLSDEGIYQCKISNRRRSVSENIHLHVQIPMIIKPARVSVEAGSEIELDCLIYSINISSISWHFSSSNRTHFSLQNIDQTYQQEKNLSKSQLIIRHAQPYHSGLWTCSYKRQRRSAKITVVQSSL